ncbi:MAG: hypothetical protein ACK5R5_01595, partial [Alphaproteobacteria bacterium]
FIVTPQQMLEKLAAASAPKPDLAAPVSMPTPAPELVSEPAASPAVDAVADAPLSVEEVGKLLGD